MTDRIRVLIELLSEATGVSTKEITRRLTQDNELLNYTEAAHLLGISETALRGRVHRGTIRFVRLGPRTVRFKRSDLMEVTS